jgi:chitin synthase
MAGERNFHVFYYLVAGASPEERQHMMLANDPSGYRYLSGAARFGYAHGGHLIKHGHHGGAAPASAEDAMRFEQLKLAFKTVGLSKRLVAQICQLVAAILHLGNIDFIHDKARNEEAAVVKNGDVLHTVSEFLGVTAGALENVFSYRSKMIKKELCTVFCDIEAAQRNRDELAVTLYSLLFAWLGEHINQKLCKDDFASYICLFDLPGFQNVAGGSTSRVNSLDQFAVNYANERLQGWTLKRIFEPRSDEMVREGLAHLVPRIPFFDNAECVRLFDNQPGGLIDIVDDQARRAPKKTEQSMVESFAKRWGNHASFQVSGMDRTGFPTFTIQHYNGPVTYSSEAFLERDADAINPDFVSLLRGSRHLASVGQRGTSPSAATDGSGSSNPFIQGLFTDRAVATQAHPHDDETIVAAQQSVKPLRKPSLHRKTSRRTASRLASVGEESEREGEPREEDHEDEQPTAAKGKRCVMGEFRSALDLLFRAMDETQSWYVFCLNPNDTQLPNQVETRHLKAQIRSLGLPEIAKAWRNTYEVSFTHEEGCERYGGLGLFDDAHRENGQPLEAMRDLARSMKWNEHDMAIGKKMVRASRPSAHRFGIWLIIPASTSGVPLPRSLPLIGEPATRGGRRRRSWSKPRWNGDNGRTHPYRPVFALPFAGCRIIARPCGQI